MAEALVWQLIRENNSFLVKRGRTKRDGAVQFSREPGNLLNVNSFKYSGIANNHVISLNQVLVDTDKRKKNPKIQLSTKVSIINHCIIFYIIYLHYKNKENNTLNLYSIIITLIITI